MKKLSKAFMWIQVSKMKKTSTAKFCITAQVQMERK